MHITPVSNTLYNTNSLKNNARQKQGNTQLISAQPAIIFQSAGVCVAGLATKRMVTGFKNKIAKENAENFKELLAGNIVNKSNAISTLNTLSRIGADKTPIRLNLHEYYSWDIYRTFKDAALKGLFPCIPELPNDSNGGHSAKFGFLFNMVKTGDYLTSSYFYDVMKRLPPSYNSEKAVLLQTMLTSKDLKQELENSYVAGEVDTVMHESPIFNKPSKTFVKLTAQSEVYKLFNVVNYVLLETLDYNTNKTFFYRNNNIIKTKQVAYKSVLEDNSNYKNKFYELYASGFRSNVLFVPELIVAKELYICGMEQFKNNKKDGMKYFNVDEEHFEDMLKDYNTYKILDEQKDKSDTEKANIIMQRFQEKEASGDKTIINSIGTFLHFAGDLGERILMQEFLRELKEEKEAFEPILKKNSYKNLLRGEQDFVQITYESISYFIDSINKFLTDNNPINYNRIDVWNYFYNKSSEYVGDLIPNRKKQEIFVEWLDRYITPKANTEDTNFGPYYELVEAYKNRRESKKLEIDLLTHHYELLY